MKISIDPSRLITLGKRVRLGFQMAEEPGTNISASEFQIGVEIRAKNAYDGVYNLTRTNYHPTAANPAYTEMHTTGPNN